MIDIAYFLTVAAASDRLDTINNANGVANKVRTSDLLLPLDTYEHNIIKNFPYLDSTTYKYELLDSIRAQLLGINFADHVNAYPQNTTTTNQSTSANYILSEAYYDSLTDAARDRLNVLNEIIELPVAAEEPPAETEEPDTPNYVSGDAYDNSLLEAALAKLKGLTTKEEE